MGYGYTEGFAGLSGEEAAIVGTVLIIYLIVAILSLCYSILVYVLQSVGMYSIAKRRGIHHPWLAWIPFGNVWILGSIGDQYHYVTAGKIKNRRKTLLILNIVLTVIGFSYGAVSGFTTVSIIMAGENVAASSVVGPTMLMLSLYFVLIVLSIIQSVIMYIAYHSLYKSCNPNNAAMFTVLGVLFSFAIPFFVFALRNKDEGMPPRRVQVPIAPWQPAPPQPAPVWQQPSAPVQQPYVPVQQYPVDQPAEPEVSIELYDEPPTENH